MTFALLSGLTTADGGTDWVGVITAVAGVILIIAGLFTTFRHGASA
jgi:hypothetical protein